MIYHKWLTIKNSPPPIFFRACDSWGPKCQPFRKPSEERSSHSTDAWEKVSGHAVVGFEVVET